MRVEDFSLFFGPRIWKIGTFGGTEYNIRSIPLGGYVKIAGMEPDDLIAGAALIPPTLSNGKPVVMYGLSEEDIASLDLTGISDRVRAVAENALAEGERRRLSAEGKLELKQLLLSTEISEEEHKYIDVLLKADAYEPDPRSYNHSPLWKRAATIVAGPAASLLFGLVIFIVMGFTTGLPDESVQRSENVIERLSADPDTARRAGIKPGDRIIKIDNTEIRDGLQMIDIIHNSPGRQLSLVVQRGGGTLTIPVTPVLSPKPIEIIENGKVVLRRAGLIGVSPRRLMVFRRYSPAAAAVVGTQMFTRSISGTLAMVFSKDVAKNTGGIIMIGAVVHEESKAGLNHILITTALLSLSLGIFNLFPIPVLDGGHLMLLAWEGIRRRKLTSKEVMTAQIFGLSIIGVLFVLITCKDFIQVILPNLVKHG